jgi:hypothetical protein
MNTRTIASALACAAFALTLAGCAQSERRTTDDGYYTSVTTNNNRACPVCGMDASSQYAAWQDGKEVDCCSQACLDKYNGSSASERRSMSARVYGQPVADNGVTPIVWSNSGSTTFTPAADGSTLVTYNGQDYAQENLYCPVTGKRLDGKHYYVIADGHRTDFANQSDAERFAAMNYEQRTSLRLQAR